MTTTNPDVSFVIAAFKAADTITRAIDSALAQEDVSVEVIVVDDASQDNTAAVVEAIADPRIRLIRLPANRGLAARATPVSTQPAANGSPSSMPTTRFAPEDLHE